MTGVRARETSASVLISVNLCFALAQAKQDIRHKARTPSLSDPRCGIMPHHTYPNSRNPLKTNTWFPLRLRYNVRAKASFWEAIATNFT